MLWQLREANATAFAEARVPRNFAKFRAQCSEDLTAEAVLGAVLTLEEMECATVVIGIDGMQNLPGFTQRAVEDGKKEPFYQVMQEVCRLINQKEAICLIKGARPQPVSQRRTLISSTRSL